MLDEPARQASLLRATSALLRGSITSLSAIALYLDSTTTLKHRIKGADRLLGNNGLHLARGALYRGLHSAGCKGYRNSWLSSIGQT